MQALVINTVCYWRNNIQTDQYKIVGIMIHTSSPKRYHIFIPGSYEYVGLHGKKKTLQKWLSSQILILADYLSSSEWAELRICKIGQLILSAVETM
jgi:hypothetical protein